MTDMAMPSASQNFSASYGISIPEELVGMSNEAFDHYMSILDRESKEANWSPFEWLSQMLSSFKKLKVSCP